MKPKISVVTAVFNAAAVLERTMLSVLNQSYADIEYIVIDGGSTDGTAEIIRKYADRLAYWVSEPDQGVYYAMNKGLSRASGEWISFMNAGDTFFGPDTLQEIFSGAIPPETAVIYGDTCIRAYGFFFREQAKPLADITGTMPFCHQAVFTRLTALRERPFDVNYRFCADYDFFLYLHRRQAGFLYRPQLICVYDAAGLSNRYYDLARQEVKVINGSGNSRAEAGSLYRKLRTFAFRNFSGLYTLLKKIQYTLFPGSARRNGWEKIRIDRLFPDEKL